MYSQLSPTLQSFARASVFDYHMLVIQYPVFVFHSSFWHKSDVFRQNFLKYIMRVRGFESFILGLVC